MNNRRSNQRTIFEFIRENHLSILCSWALAMRETTEINNKKSRFETKTINHSHDLKVLTGTHQHQRHSGINIINLPAGNAFDFYPLMDRIKYQGRSV